MLIPIAVVLIGVATPPVDAEPPFVQRLIAAAVAQTAERVVYDGSYRRIAYPGGDVPRHIGVCTDVIVRAYRAVGVDLQQRVHEDMARRLGLADGAYVRLRNQDGVVSNRVRIKATQRIRTDCVYMVHGFGHTARGLAPPYRKGASDNQLVTRYKVDPLMGGTGMNVNFVTFEAEA